MISLRTGFSRWSRAVLTASIAGLALPMFGATPDKKAASVPAKGAAPFSAVRAAKQTAKAKPPAGVPKGPPVFPAPKNAPVPAASGGEVPEFADAFPSEIRPPASDLELTPEAARKAEAQAAFAKALVAEDNAETDAALAGYRRVLELDPGYADLAVQVAYKLAQRNDVAGAIQVLKDTIKASPKEPQPLVYLSQLYAKYLKKPDLAMKYAEQAIALAPDNFNAHLAIYELHMIAGQPKKAEEVLDHAAKSKSVEAKYWVQLGDLYTRLYLKEDGSSQPAELEKMNTLYRKASELGKDDPIIQAKVGDYFAVSLQAKEAIPYYVAALNGQTSGNDEWRSKLRDKLAEAFRVTGQRDEQIKMLEQIIAESPQRFETYELLGELYEKKGDPAKALTHYEHSLLLDGSRPDNYLRVADMYLKHKDAARAVDVMRQARAKFPDVPEITFSLAVTLSQAKRHTDAMTAFAEALADAENSHEEMLTAGFYFRYGAAAEQAGLYDKAAELFRESIRLDPADAAEAYNYMGYMWVEHDMHLEEGGEMIKKALELVPDNGAFLDSLGWYYFKKGDAEKALVELLRAANAMTEEDATVFDHIGDTYQKLGKTEEALNYWEKALALDAENKKIAEKIEAVKAQTAQGAGKGK
jgi:tetratricopeptide (TPR) repeat protein